MTVRNGRIVQLSVSQIEAFDHSQEGGCERRWWFERANDLRPDQTRSQEEGEAGHALLAHYFATGEKPTGRPLMGKAVTGAIVKGELPAPGADLLVEERFSGQPKFDAAGNWLPLRDDQTLVLAGVPLEGFIDLSFRRGDVPEVWDHKFFTPARPEVSDDPYAWLKRPEELLQTVQMPVYALSQVPFWPDATKFRLVHHYVSKKGIDSKIRSAVVSVEQLRKRQTEIEAVIERMKLVAGAATQDEVPFNRRSCDAWRGCPHQAICSAYQQKEAPMSLTEAEKALFADLDDIPNEAATAATPPPPPKVEDAKPAATQPAPSAPAPEAAPTCSCGTQLTPENGSKLRDGSWKHIGCRLDAKPETPAPRTRKSKEEKAAEAAAAAASKPTPEKPVAENAAPVTEAAPKLTPLEEVVVRGGAGSREALASLLENLATLVRAVA